MKRDVKLFVALFALTTLVLSGCGNEKANSGNESSPAVSSQAQESGSPEGNGEVSAEPETGSKPAEIRLFVSDQGLPPLDKADANIAYLEQATNTDLNMVYLPHAQYEDQLRLKFASGDFPDVYQSWSGPDSDLIKAGKILELNDLIDQFGPNLKKFIPQAAWDAVSVNGRILAIPQPSDQSNSVIYMRKDWLDKLGLQVPTTSEELLDVLRAFRDKDPNGNGKPDEIPFSMREKLTWGDNIFGMWGVNNSWTEVYDGKEVVLQNIQPNMKEALAFIRTMVEEKVIDSEFLTNSKSVWEQKIKSGLVGSWSHVQALAWQWQADLNATIPGEQTDVVAIPTPRGTGYVGPLGSRWSPVGKTYIFMKDAKSPEAIVKYFDWLMSEEGQLFTDLGREGDAYKMEGGKPVVDTEKIKGLNTFTSIFKVHGTNEAVEEAKLNDPAAYAKLKAAREIGSKEGFVNEAVGMPAAKSDYNLTTMFLEAASKIVLGQAPIDSFDGFVKQWRAQGGDQLIKERTDWYNANRKK
ncbi:extracellular solute-binding protein [Cohnella herbarum]|uniref:Extracellular solute-binding protein n=1 Tax=Cohnella herbarum TaxID=2728023 RepID=A0A7Z2VPY6_9BACL|nr:extracellular solute-binding protein [Cohnella herbarum]QJD87318.1 extracellular solute-binding protein [Cohnella herbarum]